MLLQPHNLPLTHHCNISRLAAYFCYGPFSPHDAKKKCIQPLHTHTPPTPTSMYLRPGFVMITWFLHVITILKGFKLCKSEMWRKYSLYNYNRVHLLQHRFWLCEKQAALKVQQVFAERGRQEDGLSSWSSSPSAGCAGCAPLRGTGTSRAVWTPPAAAQATFLILHSRRFHHLMMQITEYQISNDTNSHLQTKQTRKPQHSGK